MTGKTGRATQVECSTLPFMHDHVLGGSLYLTQRHTGVRPVSPSGSRQSQSAAPSMEQGHPQQRFQADDLLAHRTLRQMHFGCRFGEALKPGAGVKAA